MIGSALLAATAALIASGTQLASGLVLPLTPSAASPDLAEEATFRFEDRAVSSWRAATRTTLEPAPLAVAAALFASGRPVVTRCVKLNNPWCIKSARWPGEIGQDDEGHTAFASTEFGADAAASLLRTYYVTLGRRSALDIVRRWAPAECRIGTGGGLPLAIAVNGLANTLRGRFLASRRAGGSGTAQPRPVVARAGAAPAKPAGGRPGARPAGPRVSSVPPAPMPTFRVPDLVAGMGERPPPKPVASAPRPLVQAAAAKVPARSRPAAPVRVASTDSSAPMPMPTASTCGSEEGRIQYYGAAIAKALGVSPSDDLALFDEAGQPTDNLLPVMVAMSSIELGYLHAGPELAERAIGRLRLRLALAAVPPAPPEKPADLAVSPTASTR